MSLISTIIQGIVGIGKRLAALDDRLSAVEKKTRTLDAFQTVFMCDSSGNITDITYYRADGSQLARSSLSQAVNADGSWTKTRTARHYALDGTTVLLTEVYTVEDDGLGRVTETRVS